MTLDLKIWRDLKGYYKYVLRDMFSRRKQEIPAGTYSCKVKHVQLHRSKLGTPTMDLELEIIDGTTKGVKGKKVTLRCPT